MNAKKTAIGVFVLGLVACGLLWGSKVMSEEQTKSGKFEQASLSKKCKGNVQLEMGNVKLSVPRDDYTSVRPINKEAIPRLSEPYKDVYDCSTKDLGQTSTFTWGFSLINPTIINPEFKTTYEKFSQLIKQAQDQKKSTKIFEDIENIKLNQKELFILPQSQSPTYNQEPVVIECQNRGGSINLDRCKTAYFHPSGLIFEYEFSRSLYPENKYLGLDLEKRHKFESLIIK